MKRILSLAVLGVVLGTAPSAFAQPGGRPGPGRPARDGDRRPDAELERLRAQVKELEAKLAAREPDRRSDSRRDADRYDRRPGGPDRARFGPPEGRGPRPSFRGPGGFGGPSGWGRRDDRSGPARTQDRDDRRPGARPEQRSWSDLSRRIDRIILELEQLRQEAERPRR